MFKKKIERISIENTTFCAASCVMCPRDTYVHPLETMNLSLFKKCVDECIELGLKEISVGGYGEALMDKELEEKLKYIKGNSTDILIGLTTTGYLLEGELQDIICQYVDILKFSHYGFTKQSYERVHRGSLKFEEIRSNIESVLKREKRPYTILSFLDLPENHDDMEPWKNYWEPKADRIDIWKPHNYGSNVIKSAIDKARMIKCPWVENLESLSIHTDGSVSLCVFDINRKMSIGNIKQSKLKDIVSSDKLKEIQELHLTKEILQSDYICKYCDQITDRRDALIYSSGTTRIGQPSLKIFKEE
jgi:radical SAM protein with 4Fe4S-binding SPASM domain